MKLNDQHETEQVAEANEGSVGDADEAEGTASGEKKNWNVDEEAESESNKAEDLKGHKAEVPRCAERRMLWV